MPIIRHAAQKPLEPYPGIKSLPVARKEFGAVSLSISDTTVRPGARIPLHIHPGHEEAIVILEGELEATLGDEVRVLGPGNTVLAPPDVKHKLENKGKVPARFLAIFPVIEPKRSFLG
jgi:quercetin dioxygenase-like cupin family protein